MTIEDSGGKVTFAGKEPVRKTVIKAGATAGCVPTDPRRRGAVSLSRVGAIHV
jgi:hypothetical protein